MNIYFVTFGCKVNSGEDQFYLSQLIEHGYTETNIIDDADIVVINTCAVTEHAAKKSANYIAKIKSQHKDLKVVVTGCLTEEKGLTLKEYGADLIVTNGSKSNLVEHILNMTDGLINASEGAFAGGALKLKTNTKTRAFFKIQDGCDANCTYCIIPKLRGVPKSMPLEQAITGFKELLNLGYKEIVLVGIHIGLYGRDLGYNIADLLEALIAIDGDFRIRLTSIEINEINDRMINLIANSDKICSHLHIPLQSGSNKILNLMGRHYSQNDYIETIKSARNIIKDVTIGSDIISGFPTEDEDDFLNTKNTLIEAGTEFYHSFPYSEREGTVAATMEGSIPVKIREERAAALRQIGHDMMLKRFESSIGKTYRVLSEKGNKGHSENYLLIHFDKDVEPNNFINVLVTEVKDSKLIGKVI